jgi:hypothetical protein
MDKRKELTNVWSNTYVAWHSSSPKSGVSGSQQRNGGTNVSYHTTIQMSPFQVLYEYPPPLLQNIRVPIATPQDTTDATEEKENMVILLQQNLSKAQARMKKYADTRRTERAFELGDFVYLKAKPYRQKALGA